MFHRNARRTLCSQRMAGRLVIVVVLLAMGLGSASAQSGDVFLPLVNTRDRAPQGVGAPQEPVDADGDADEAPGPGGAPDSRIEAEAFSATTWTVQNNLGIGTQAPAQRIDVRHSANSIARLSISNTSGGSAAQSNVYLQTGAGKSLTIAQYGPGHTGVWGDAPLATRARLRTEGSSLALILTTGGNAPLIFGTNDAERARISANGNVGIGTVAPVHKLSVIGGPSWTSNGWIGSIELVNGSAIGWRENTSGYSFGMGQTTGGFHIFRTYADPGTTGNSAEYDLTIDSGGWVGIGTTSPASKLHVQSGNIRVTNGSFVDDGVTLNVPDYVFEPDYPLLSPDELRAYIAREKHLPNVPSEEEIKAGGLDLGAFHMRLLEKVEELTLYTLAQDERIADLEARLAALEAQPNGGDHGEQ